MSAAISGHADVGQRVSGGRAGEPMTLQRVLRPFGPVRLKGGRRPDSRAAWSKRKALRRLGLLGGDETF